MKGTSWLIDVFVLADSNHNTYIAMLQVRASSM